MTSLFHITARIAVGVFYVYRAHFIGPKISDYKKGGPVRKEGIMWSVRLDQRVSYLLKKSTINVQIIFLKLDIMV